MFNIKATPLNVIHCDYNHYVGEMLVQTEFDFKDGIAFSKETGKPVQILFRLTTRTHYQNKTILSYVTEQTFRFVPDTDGILFKHVSIGYNGRNWVRTTEVFEYDPAIKIEAPIQ